MSNMINTEQRLEAIYMAMQELKLELAQLREKKQQFKTYIADRELIKKSKYQSIDYQLAEEYFGF